MNDKDFILVASSTAATYSNNQKPSTSTSSSALKKNIGGEYSSNSSKRVASTTAAVDIEDDTTSVNPGSKIKPTGRVVNKSRSNNNIINNNKNIDGIEDDDIEDDDGDDVDEQVVGVRQKKMKVMEQQRIARPPRGQDSSSLMKHILNPTPGVINYTALSNHPVIAAPAAENDDSSSNVKGSGRPESIAACDGDKIDQTVEATRSTTMTPFMTKCKIM